MCANTPASHLRLCCLLGSSATSMSQSSLAILRPSQLSGQRTPRWGWPSSRAFDLILSALNKRQHLLVMPTITGLGIGEHENGSEYVPSLRKMIQIWAIGFLLIRPNVLHYAVILGEISRCGLAFLKLFLA